MTSTDSGWGGVEAFEIDGWRGELHRDFEPADLAAALRRPVDPGQAEETLHWGRNYLYRQQWHCHGKSLPVVVKQFRNRGLKARLRRRMRGSKAELSFRAAKEIARCGVLTPTPLLYVDSVEPTGPSYYVCAYMGGTLEARYLLRALNASREDRDFPEIDSGRVLTAIGALIRRLHDGGFWHRDMTSGNVLIRPERFAPAEPEASRQTDEEDDLDSLIIVDLNRSRYGRRLSLRARVRDLSRMPIFRPEDRALYLGGYWQQRPGLLERLLAGTLFGLYHYGFRAKNRTKQGVRGGLRSLQDMLLPRRAAHAHIPPPDADAGARDKVVWDRLSDQPHQHAGRLEKLKVRLLDAPSHVRTLSAAALATPRIYRRYRQLQRERQRTPRQLAALGIALRPWRDQDALLEAVGDLGIERVLLRLHPWQSDHEPERRLAEALSARGCQLIFALPQNRELVRSQESWSRSIRKLGHLFLPYGHRFQIGQAINRSKWGVWTADEYARLFRRAARELEALRSDVELLGPAVIDFEFHTTAAMLNLRKKGLRFDAVSSLLYVDRRGAPENRQLGFDTVDKVLLLKAIAETGRNCPSGRSVITEVNWPLREGPHSPAGRDVAVDEERQADYLVRYCLLALTTGAVEAVYWWQLIARGYGLIDPGAHGLRRRPSFEALRHLQRLLGDATFMGSAAVDRGDADVHLLRFDCQEGECLVGWTASDDPAQLELERPLQGAFDRSGKSIDCRGRSVVLDGSPRYLLTESRGAAGELPPTAAAAD